MRASWTSWLAISLWTVAMLLVGCILLLGYANGSRSNIQVIEGLLFIIAFVSLASVGALLATHRPENPIGWIFLVTALGLASLMTADLYAEYITVTSPGTLPELTPLFWIGAWSWILMFLPATFGVLLFPTGRLPSRRWRILVWLTGCWLALWIIAEMFSPGELNPDPSGTYQWPTNPAGISVLGGLFDFVLSDLVLTPVMALLIIGSATSLFARLRQATDLERQQIKWFALAATIPLSGLAVVLVLIVLPVISYTTANTVGAFMILIGITFLPAAIGIAILRHNLYDIDRLINRTAVYGSLTLLLLLSFFGSVILFQFLLDPLTGGNDLAVAGSTLLIAALFRPVRDRVQRFVDRRFYRRKYDAQQTLQTFSVTARDAVQIDELTGSLTEVVTRTVQPEHVSIWLNRLDVREDRQ